MRKTKEMILTGIFTALIIVGSFIKIPLYPVPVVLTYLCVNLVILLAKRKTATFSVLIYILIGLAGIPVFTQGGGIGYVFNLTFGYILGFFISSVIGGKIKELNFLSDKPFFKNLTVSCVNVLIIYTSGLLYAYMIIKFYMGKSIDFSYLLTFYALIFIPGDVLSAFVSSYLAKKLKGIVE